MHFTWINFREISQKAGNRDFHPQENLSTQRI